jgi:hypothetical protein
MSPADQTIRLYKNVFNGLKNDFLNRATVVTNVYVLRVVDDLADVSERMRELGTPHAVYLISLHWLTYPAAIDEDLKELPHGRRGFESSKGCLEGTRERFLLTITE